MSLLRCVTTVWLLLAVAETGTAQSQQQIDSCNGKNNSTPDSQIISCTELIQNPKYAGADLAGMLGRRGRVYYGMRQYDRAIADYDEAIRLDPNNAVVFSARGLVFYFKGQHDRAIADYDQAIRLNAKLVEAFNNRGTAYSSKGQHDRAIADYDQAIRLKPNYAEAFSNRCLARVYIGELQLALSDCDHALRIDPNTTSTLQVRGVNLLKLGRAATTIGERFRYFNAAIADFDAALKINSRLTVALYGRGIAKQEIGSRASGEVDKAVALSINKTVVEELTKFGVKGISP